MSENEHKYINLKTGDTVIISSSPIPGNEVRYDQISNRLSKKGVRLFRHPTHELDGCGALHVSGHARRDELREMIQLVRPKFFIPVHAGTLRRKYHAEIGIQEGVLRQHTLLPENGDSLYFTIGETEKGKQGGLDRSIENIIAATGLQVLSLPSTNGNRKDKIYKGFDLRQVSATELETILQRVQANIDCLN